MLTSLLIWRMFLNLAKLQLHGCLRFRSPLGWTLSTNANTAKKKSSRWTVFWIIWKASRPSNQRSSALNATAATLPWILTSITSPSATTSTFHSGKTTLSWASAIFWWLIHSCVECGKIHYNIAALIKHYEGEHPAIANIYPCIECGYYAQSFTQLKIHILGHKTQEVSDSEDEEPASKVKKIAEGQKNWGSKDDQESHSSSASSSGSSKNYHPKAYSGKRASKQFNSDPGKHRKTFPCDKCDRV